VIRLWVGLGGGGWVADFLGKLSAGEVWVAGGDGGVRWSGEFGGCGRLRRVGWGFLGLGWAGLGLARGIAGGLARGIAGGLARGIAGGTGGSAGGSAGGTAGGFSGGWEFNVF